MVQVSTFSELGAALRDRQTPIRVAADIEMTSTLYAEYKVTIESASSERAAVLSKKEAYSGYMLRVRNGGELTLQNIILDGSKAGDYSENNLNRSLVLVEGGSLILDTGAVLQNNSSYQEGGGAYLSGNASYSNTFLMQGNARITGCGSRTSGGGFMAAIRNAGDRVIITGRSLVDQNRADNGGGIYVRPYLAGLANVLTLDEEATITENTASAAGGGVYFSGYRGSGSLQAQLMLEGNAAVTKNTARQGGGIYFYGTDAEGRDGLRMSEGAVVSGNTASENGGGICITSSPGAADFTMTATSGGIDDNRGGTGGGLYFYTTGGGHVSVSPGRISSNQAVNGEAGSGGGIWFQNDSASAESSMTFLSADIEHNEASAQGGGVYYISGPSRFTFRALDTLFGDNSAGTNGGGILLGAKGAGEITVDRSSISGNRSGHSGGAFYLANTGSEEVDAVLTQTTVSENRAGYEGGGLRFSAGAGTLNTTLSDSAITNNTAEDNSGGGIWAGGNNNILKLTGETSVSNNSSEAGNGGGIYFTSQNGILTLADDVKVNQNRADGRETDFGNKGGGICVIPGIVIIQDRAELAENSALKYGGGLSASESSSIEMSGGSVHGNTAVRQGGGVWNHSGSTLTLTGGDIYGNHSQIGGAVFNDVGSTATIAGAAEIGGGGENTAERYAPGIYNAGMFYTEGQRELSNGLYIVDRSAAAYIQGPLEDGSVIQLNSSGYVKANEEGTPIVVAEATTQYPELSQADADAFRKPPEGFDGWEIRLSGDRTQVLLAPIRYKITYENLQGTGNTNPTEYTAATPDIVLADPGQRPGCRFLGWYDAPEGGDRVTVIPRGSTGDITLYARWESTAPPIPPTEVVWCCCPCLVW